jgi:hypothetical protein
MPIALLPPPTQATTRSGDGRRRRGPARAPRADHLLEAGDDRRERVRAERAAEDVVRLDRIRDPRAHRLVDRVLERPLPVLDDLHARAEELHAQEVRAAGAPRRRRP